MAVLVLADHDQGRLAASVPRVIAAVAELGPVDVLAAGQDVDGVGAEAALVSGVARVLVASDAAYAAGDAAALATLLAQLAESYEHIVAVSSAVGRDVMPRLAARLDLMPVTDVVAILAPNRFQRPIYAGNAVETVTSNQARHLVTIRASAFRPAAGGNSAPVEPVAAAGIGALTTFMAEHRTEGDRPDLSTARVVVAGGVSFGSAANFALVEKLGATLGAAIGATRAAVDAGYAPNDWQVGQTGKIIAPDLYVGIGISGALQHLAGIQGAKKIVAINTDPEAPLMKLADVALVGDLNEVVPALIAALERR